MRTMSSVMSSTIAIGILIVSPARVFAQAYQPDSDEVSRNTGLRCTPCMLDGTLVVGAPFSAEATMVWQRREERKGGGTGYRAAQRKGAFGWAKLWGQDQHHSGSS